MGLFNKFSNKKKYKQTSLPDAVRSSQAYSGGTWINEETAMEVAAYYRGVMYIATQLSKLPWIIKTDNNTRIVDAIHKLLRYQPNPEMDSMFFRLHMTTAAINHGNAYAEIERTMLGEPIAIWPIAPGECEPVRDTSGKLWYQVNSTATQSGRTLLMAPKDVFMVRNPHTKDGIVGQNIIGYAIEALGIAKGADKFANALFANGAMPAGVLTVPGELSDDAFARLKESWDKNHTGRKTGGTAILEEGAKYEALTLPPEVLQFLESRQFSVLEIARFLGVPPQKLFDSKSATYNNIEHANLEVVTDTLDVWAKIYEMQTEVKLLMDNKGTRATQCEMDLKALFRGDMDTRSNYFKSRMQTASMTPNQIRMMEGDAPYEGGDEYYVAANNYSPVSRLDEIIDSQIAKKEASDTEGDKDKAEAELAKAATAYLNK